MASRLKQRYQKDVLPALTKELGFKNPMQTPRMEKIVLNIGLGESIANAKAMEAATKDMATVSGQRPVVTRAKKSIANFKLRKGMAIGLKVTLRGKRMYDFYDRLVNAVLPRIRDFQGVPEDAFDGRGNYTLGIKEQIAFPEIEYDKIDKIRGLQVCIITTAGNDAAGRRFLELMGMPFAK